MTELKGYHAHVYYDPATRPTAERLRDTIVSQFAVEPGAFSAAPSRRDDSAKACSRDTSRPTSRR